MKLLNEELMDDTTTLAFSYIADYQIALLGIEGIAIQKKEESLNKAEPIAAETIYCLAKGALKILNRKELNDEDEHCYDTSDFFSDYFNRVSIKNDTVKIRYWEKGRNPEWEDYVEINNLDVAKRIFETIICMIDECENI